MYWARVVRGMASMLKAVTPWPRAPGPDSGLKHRVEEGDQGRAGSQQVDLVDAVRALLGPVDLEDEVRALVERAGVRHDFGAGGGVGRRARRPRRRPRPGPGPGRPA